ncbi:MAG TPA: phosphoribosylformylglycinamidine synthase subunit PurQ, partial [Candidatus Saccharimonadales bacterium]|nr:phosphoribosylformylglycinamidine synthase subunit PurQ [Candidatus Saccharimonadales bacterium]
MAAAAGIGGAAGRGPRFGVVVFPGSNCDHDTYHVLKHVLGLETVWLWHKEADLAGCDVVVLPGGFAHGDYLRAGAIARFSPVMPRVVEHARRGGLVLGICNGFQVLVESGLLPGALMRNRGLKFICRDVFARVETSSTALTGRCAAGTVLRLPVAHGEGNYVADAETIRRLEGEGRVIFRYAAPDGSLDEAWNVNGSANAIAGIVNEGGNVFGLMPHPERASERVLGCEDGRVLFESLAAA